MAFEIRVPRLGWSMEEGTFVGWLKKEGDLVIAGENLFSLEGEKATQDIEALDSGILHIHPQSCKPGQVVAVGALLGALIPQGQSHSWNSPTPSAPATAQPTSPQSTPAAPSVRRLARQKGISLESIQGSGRGGRILSEDLSSQPSVLPSRTTEPQASYATPRARKLAQKLNIDWKTVSGTGKGGRVRERDLLTIQTATTPLREGWIQVPVSFIRKRIAERLVQSRQNTVPVTMTTKADASALVQLREWYKKAGGVVPTFTDILGKLTALCLLKHPLLVSQWTGSHLESPPRHGIHIGIAVDTKQGLLVPVIRDLVHLHLLEIAKSSQELTAAARQGKLPAEAMQGGTFTISSLGSLGVEFFTPVINPPETAILGVGAIQNEVASREDGSFFAIKRLPLSLTFDHRIVDGAPAARFLMDLVGMIEKPAEAIGVETT